MDTVTIKTYCDFVKTLDKKNVHKQYHDKEYGFSIDNDNELFGRLVLEINQAGLSWDTILKKKENFFKAYENFEIARVAKFNQKKFDALMQDAGIIRNRLKINAAIENAKVILQLQKRFGSFKKWLEHNHPLTKEEWVKLFKQHFKFTGGEIVNEFLMSTGYLPGSHAVSCPVYKKVATKKTYVDESKEVLNINNWFVPSKFCFKSLKQSLKYFNLFTTAKYL